MKRILSLSIFVAALSLLFACSETSHTELNSEQNTGNSAVTQPAMQPLDFSLPKETTIEQATSLKTEKPLLPELFDQEKEPSKIQFDGRLLLEEKAPLNADALDGAKVSITVKQ